VYTCGVANITAGHIVCGLVEERLFPGAGTPRQ